MSTTTQVHLDSLLVLTIAIPEVQGSHMAKCKIKRQESNILPTIKSREALKIQEEIKNWGQ